MKNQITTLLKLRAITATVSVFLISCSSISQAQIFKIVDSSDMRLSYNSKTVVLDSGKRQTEFHGKWINYMDETNTWKEIDPVFVKTTKGFEMNEAPFEVLAPFYADEPAVFNNNNRYDVFTNEIIYDKPLEQTIQALGTAHVAGITETGDLGWGKAQYVVYPDAYPEIHADLIYWVHQGTAPRLRKFIRFNQKLIENTDFKFRVIYSDEVETLNNGENVTVTLKGANSKRGSGWDNFYIWDSKGGWTERKPIRFDFEKQMLTSVTSIITDPNEYILTKHIEADYFKTAILPVFTDATSTFYPDAGTGATTVDGQLKANTSPNTGGYDGCSNFPSDHAATSSTPDNTGTTMAAYVYTSTYWGDHITRIIILFNTSSLTNMANISSATLKVYLNDIGNTNTVDQGIDLVQSNPGSNTVLTSADYIQVGKSLANGWGSSSSTDIITDANVMVGNFVTGGYTNFVMGSTGIGWINKTDVTKLGLREHHDVTGTGDACPMGRGVLIYSADQTGTDYDPKLEVTHTPASVTPAIVNWNNGNIQEITLSEHRSFTFTNGKSGAEYTLIIKQDGTGGKAVTWPTEVRWTNGTTPTLTATAGAADIVRFVYDGTKYLEITTTLNIPY